MAGSILACEEPMSELAISKLEYPMREEPQVKAKNILSKDDFLKLFMTQMRYQDPLNPKDYEAFASQLAQFSSIEQLTNIHKGVENLRSDMVAEQRIQALGMIGKLVKASGNRIDLIKGQEVPLKYIADENVHPFRAMIFDKNNKLIREIDLFKKEQGDSVIIWNGKDQSGNEMPSGTYMFKVIGVDRKGDTKELSTELSGEVVGVELDGKNPNLLVKTDKGNSRVSLASVTKVEVGRDTPPSNQTGRTEINVDNTTLDNGSIHPDESESSESIDMERWRPNWFDVSRVGGRHGNF